MHLVINDWTIQLKCMHYWKLVRTQYKLLLNTGNSSFCTVHSCHQKDLRSSLSLAGALYAQLQDITFTVSVSGTGAVVRSALDYKFTRKLGYPVHNRTQFPRLWLPKARAQLDRL